MHYEFVRDGFQGYRGIRCAICNRAARHRLALPATIVEIVHLRDLAVPPEKRGLCRECGRGRHSLTTLSDDEITRLRGGTPALVRGRR